MPADSPSDGGRDPHADQPIETAGAPPAAAEAAVILLHGRGSSATHVLRLVDEFLHHGAMYLAPRASGSAWYPRSFLAPTEENEPWLSSAFGRVSAALDVAADAGVPPERTVVFGFSQGACLACEFVARNARRYGGVVALSGGLMGPDPDAWDHGGSLDGTPVFLGCSDDDPHVPAERVRASADELARLDGDVVHRLYEGLGHAINDDEVRAINEAIEATL